MPRAWTIKEHIDAGHYPVQGQVPLRDGTVAMIYTTDHPQPDRPIIGAYPVRDSWRLRQWSVHGRYATEGIHQYDIAPPPPRRRPIECWAVTGPLWSWPVTMNGRAVCEEYVADHPSDNFAVVLLTGVVEEPWPEIADEETPVATTVYVDSPGVAEPQSVMEPSS